MVVSNRNLLFQGVYFQGRAVSFREGNNGNLGSLLTQHPPEKNPSAFRAWATNSITVQAEGTGLEDLTSPYHPWDRYMYLHECLIFMVFHVGKYTSPMDPMGHGHLNRVSNPNQRKVFWTTLIETCIFPTSSVSSKCMSTRMSCWYLVNIVGWFRPLR